MLELTPVWCGKLVASRGGARLMPNPSIERARAGMALQALISFWALRALPARAANVKR